MVPQPTFEEQVIQEEDFVVVFANTGQELKRTPRRLRYPNPETERVECGVDGCDETTRSQYGVCTDHYSNKHRYATHTADWIAGLTTADTMPDEVSVPTHLTVTRHLWRWAQIKAERLEALDRFIIDDGMANIPCEVPDATALQEYLQGDIAGITTPQELSEMTCEAVETAFPEARYGGELLGTDTETVRGMDISWSEIPVRVAAALFYLALICEESNRGDGWYIDYADIDDSPERAGAYMALSFYVLLRNTDMNPDMAERIVNSGYF